MVEEIKSTFKKTSKRADLYDLHQKLVSNMMATRFTQET